MNLIVRRPVIAIAGLASENSTFTPSRTEAPAFHPQRGDEAIEFYKFLHPDTPLGDAADWRGALIGHALPGGRVTKEAFEELSGEILERLRGIIQSLGPDGVLDGLWLDIHGAMYVEGHEDIEAELLRRIRTVIGPDTIVSASMDLHGNVSRKLAHQTDLITCYRMAPHEDELDTKERACQNLVNLLLQRPHGIRPIKVWIPIPVLLPGEQTSTRDEPAKHIYAAVPEVENLPGILDAAIWVGYAWADEPRNRAVVMTTGWDKSAVISGAEHLAKLFWDAHADFHFVAPTGSFTECFDIAITSPLRPYFISDSGDNPTAGGSGDVTWTLHQLLKRPEIYSSPSVPAPPTILYASIPSPLAVQTAVSSGLNTLITVTAGAEIDNTHSPPISLQGRVHAIKHGDPHALTEIVLHLSNTNIFVIITSKRKPYHKEHDITDLNLDPYAADIVFVKIGYLEPELYNIAKNGGWMLALTPGGVDQDLKRLGHKRIRRPMWPFDPEGDFEGKGREPDLRGRIVEMSFEELVGGEV